MKLSQEYVAEQLGVSRQAVSKWETGQSEPTASNLIQLAAVFEMNLSELVAPNKNDKEQSSFKNEQTSTKPNLILRANLINKIVYLFFLSKLLYQQFIHCHKLIASFLQDIHNLQRRLY